MLEEARTEEHPIWLDEQQAILPIMTALFVDGLGPVQSRVDSIADWFRKIPSAQEGIRMLRVPIESESPISIADWIEPREERSQKRLQIPGPLSSTFSSRHAAVRLLIKGISHHFNNLLMGIWGNATLIRMQLPQDHPLFARMTQMERLIQSGAFLIHMVLGYLGERRNVAKRIRLNQLMMEIKNEMLDHGGDDEAPWNFEGRLKWASRVQRPRMIASSTARVLEVLFQGIGAHCKDIVFEKKSDLDIGPKMETIAALVVRGLEITHRLRLYAGDLKTDERPVRLDVLAKRLVALTTKRHPGIRTTCEIKSNLPSVLCDRRQLEHALLELLSNAVAAMSGQGELAVNIRTLYPRALKNRCADQYKREYVVISIADNGCGICQRVQRRVFEPFFADPLRHGKRGLGLAAVDGIMAIHNGHIQLQSEKGKGTTLTLYLPAAQQPGNAVETKN